jgi:ribonucleoside-diphosphate reductase alpha chain
MHSAEDGPVCVRLEDYAFGLWRDGGGDPARLPRFFVDAASLSPEAHLAMQAVLQPWVDNAISKTINVPEDLPFERFCSLFEQAYELGLKGCTAFRPNRLTGTVLANRREDAIRCCGPDREND